MKRRKIIKITAGTIGWCIAGGTVSAVMSGCKTDTSDGWKPGILNKDQMNFVAEFCEMIIPKTDTPGAKDALIHRYVDEAIHKYFDVDEKAMFFAGVDQLNKLAKDLGGKSFAKSDQNTKVKIMDGLVADAKEHEAGDHKDPHFFSSFSGFVKHAFFTSEVGQKEVLKYDPVPGPYKGCIAYSEIGGAWAQ